jgi:hypothetical protein
VPFAIEASAEAEAKLIVPRLLLRSAKQAAQREDRHGPGAPLFAGAAFLGLGALALGTRRRIMRGLVFAVLVSGAVFVGHTGLRAQVPPVGMPVVLPEARLQGVRVEITEEGDAIRLLLPRAKFAEFARDLKMR